jgi:hypothetical protein
MINYELWNQSKIGKVLLRFYIFKGERLQNDYIKECKLMIYTAMQKKLG